MKYDFLLSFQEGRLIYLDLLFLKLHEEKIFAIEEKLELSDQKLTQYSKLPDIEEELKVRMEALSQVSRKIRHLAWLTAINIQFY